MIQVAELLLAFEILLVPEESIVEIVEGVGLVDVSDFDHVDGPEHPVEVGHDDEQLDLSLQTLHLLQEGRLLTGVREGGLQSLLQVGLTLE